MNKTLILRLKKFRQDWKEIDDAIYVSQPNRLENILILNFLCIRILTRYEIYTNDLWFTLATISVVYAFGNYSYRALFLELIPNSKKYWRENIAPRRRHISSSVLSGVFSAMAFKAGKPILGTCLACLSIYDYCDYRFEAIYGYTISAELRRYSTGMQSWEQTKNHILHASQYADSTDIPIVQDLKKINQNQDLALKNKDLRIRELEKLIKDSAKK